MRSYQREQNPNLKSAATQIFKKSHFRRQTLDTSQQLFLQNDPFLEESLKLVC